MRIYIKRTGNLFGLIFLICSWFGHTQNSVEPNSNYGFDLGISGKVQFEFGYRYKPSFKLSVAAAIGYEIDKVHVYPTFHSGLIFFNRGPIGSKLNNPWLNIHSHFFYSAIATVRLDKRDFTFNERYVPLYHFSDFTANPLQNPFKSSLSYGAIWVKMSNNTQQRIGFFNANIVGRIQVSYYNDGGPVLSIVGDKRDRYYTGGLVLSYHGNMRTDIHLAEVSFHKFTGYTRHAFDVGDKLQLDHVIYADPQQFAYNQQRWRITLSNFESGFSGFISFYNFNALDLQDFLHFTTSVPYHPDYYDTWSIELGGKYENNNYYISR